MRTPVIFTSAELVVVAILIHSTPVGNCEDVGRATHLRGVLLDAAMRGQLSA